MKRRLDVYPDGKVAVVEVTDGLEMFVEVAGQGPVQSIPLDRGDDAELKRHFKGAQLKRAKQAVNVLANRRKVV